MKSIRPLPGFLAALLALNVFVGCAVAPKAEAPAQPAATSLDEREPTTLAEAEALLEKARGDLDRLALNEPMPATATAPPAGAAAPSIMPTPAPRAEAERADKSAADSTSASERASEEAPRPKEVSACETACKAFSSLSRASDAVCRLDEEGGQRCERAKKIRQDASRRVASCGCAQ